MSARRVKGSGREPLCVEAVLEMALRKAFEVALEIALSEISRLIAARARLDACEQMRYRQWEKDTLKSPAQHLSHAEAGQSSSYSLREDIPRDEYEKQDDVHVCVDESEGLNGYFHISHEGRVRSREMNTSPTNGQDASDQKEFNVDPIQDVDPSVQDFFKLAIEQVKVKSEKPDQEELSLNNSSWCVSPSLSPDYNFDNRMTLVQSKLLKDWRPDSEKPQKQTEPLDQEPSHGQGSSKIYLPSSGCVSPVSTPFHNLYLSAADRTSLTQSPQNCNEQVRTNIHSSLYICKFCGHVFHSSNDLCNHHIQHHRTILMSVEEGTIATRPRKQQLFPPGCSPYHCSMCKRDFNRLENLKTHLRIHTGERPYSCSLCGVRFRHSGALTRHFRIHTGEKPYVCEECGKSFRNCGGLRYHQKSHHPSTVFETRI